MTTKHHLLWLLLLVIMVVPQSEATYCGRFICGNDTYTGSGDLSGKTWANIQDIQAKNYYNNTHGWNQTQTWSNGSLSYLWMPWYVSADSMAESNLKDTYTQSLWGVDGTWANNTAVTDEGSELSMAAVMNWSNNELRLFINYLDICADNDSNHVAEGPWLTSWVCSQKSGVVTVNDRNSASDATARLALTLFMANKNPNFNSTMRALAGERAVNITRAGLREEWVTTCQNSTVNGSAQLCRWHLAGAGQAWGGGALTQAGQQMFYGYHESNIMSYLAAYAYTHEEKYSSAARNETHQFLFVMGFKNQGNTSAHFNVTTGGAHYYLDCSTANCTVLTQSGATVWDDADATRAWETCNNVEYAILTYGNFSEALPWEFAALQRYCQAWTSRMGPTGGISNGGTTFANVTSGCYRIKNGGTCDTTGIIGLNSYKEAGWISNLVAKQNNATYYNTFSAPTLSTYSTTNDYYTGQTGFGVYGPVRYLRSIRSATGYYDFLFTNTTFNYTTYATGASSGGGGGSPAVNYTLTLTMNNTNTSVAVASFCATISSQACTTNGTLHFTELNNGTYNLSYTSATLQNSSRNITVAGNTAYTIQEEENPGEPAAPVTESPTSLSTCESMANATGKLWMILMGIALLVLLSITKTEVEIDPVVIGSMIAAATMGLLVMAIGTGLICQIG